MNNFNRQIIGVVVFLSVIVFAATAVKAFLGNPDPTVTVGNNYEAPPDASGWPRHLSIPSVDISANVQYVGRGRTGNMAVPYGYQDVGWYRYGPLPGEPGSAVMDGHVDNGFGLAGVFKRLKEVKPGDRIFTTAQDGNTLTFIVDEVEVYAEDKVPLETIFNRKDAARLNLITCSGDWDEASKSYNQRLVVYSRLEGSKF